MSYLVANWDAPSSIRALTTTRLHGSSVAPYDKNNLALHVHDNELHVLQNRINLCTALALPKEPAWLEQTHSNQCIDIDTDPNRYADAAITRQTMQPLVILTGDCLPILLCHSDKPVIAAIHAGWRGLVAGIIDNTITKMAEDPNALMAWVGPAICSSCYQVGEELHSQYLKHYPYVASGFHYSDNTLYANLPLIAALILNHLGVQSVSQSAVCTYEQHHRYFSARRANPTGRIATLIWRVSL